MAPQPSKEQSDHFAEVVKAVDDLAALLAKGSKIGAETVIGFDVVPAASDAIPYRTPRVVSKSFTTGASNRSKAPKSLNPDAVVVD